MKPVSMWFRPKTIGWGWSPASWEGWLITALVAAAVAGTATLLR